MTEPTDAEIKDLYAQETGFVLDDSPAALLDFARAVLAKWGTPPAVAGEPIGYLYCGGSYGDELADWEVVADQHQCDKLNEHHGALGKEAKLPLYTTPQPTQAQAGAVPLTDEQRNAIYDKHCFLGDNGWEINWWQVIDEVEAAHGINGGQHG